MIDFDSIWRSQDEIRTVVRSSSARLLPTGRKNAVLGALGLWTLATNGTQECIWNLSFNEKRMAIELELTVTLDDDTIDNLCCQFPISADYDGSGSRGSKFAFYL